MPAPASRDLRERVVDAYEAGEGSMRDLALAFQVNLKSVHRWIARKNTTGSVDPAPHGGGRPKKIPEQARVVLRGLVQKQPDATLVEFAERLEALTEVAADPPRVCEALEQMGLPRKKRAHMQASKTGPTSRSKGRSSRSRKRA